MAKGKLSLLSSATTMKRIASLISRYHQLPFTAADSIPGAVMEGVLEIARGSSTRVLRTYDFVDVVDEPNGFGWQVKSTKPGTPVTWKRAKLPDAAQRRAFARTSKAAAQKVGAELIEFCNEHAVESLHKFNLDEIGYSRLIVRNNNVATYFERPLISKARPTLFKASDFTWRWTESRASATQQSSLAGYDSRERRWFSWHSENQLHFNNESAWWPQIGDPHRIDFALPTTKLSIDTVLEWLESLD